MSHHQLVIISINVHLKPNNFLTSLLGEVASELGHQAASTMNDIDIGRGAESAWKVANNVCP
jgi:hypothetical protein